MNNENIKKEAFAEQLEHLEFPEIEMPVHKRQLRMALLSAPRFARSPMRYFWNAIGNASSMKKLIPIGTVALVAAVAIFVGLEGNTPHADAQQLARLSVASVSALPSAEGSALAAILNADPETVLNEAENASDLTMLTYDQFIAQYPQGVTQAAPAGAAVSAAFIAKMASSTIVVGTSTAITTPTALTSMANIKARIDAAKAALKTAKFLQFSDPQGNKVVVAVSTDNIPISVNITLKNGLRMGMGQQSL